MRAKNALCGEPPIAHVMPMEEAEKPEPEKPEQLRSLAELEIEIVRQQQAAVTIGRLLGEIKARGLFLGTDADFVTYAFRRWRYKKAYAYELLEAADALDAIGERFRKSAHVDCTKLIPLLNGWNNVKAIREAEQIPEEFQAKAIERAFAVSSGRKGPSRIDLRCATAFVRGEPQIFADDRTDRNRRAIAQLERVAQRLREAPIDGLDLKVEALALDGVVQLLRPRRQQKVATP